MSQLTKKFAVVFGALLVAAACDSATTGVTPTVSEPEVGPPPPRLGHARPHRGSVSSSIIGDGEFLNPAGMLRTFSFTALDQRGPGGATVVGQFDLKTAAGGHFHGIITCFVIEGNVAWIGAQLTQAPPFPVVAEIGFQVIDNRPPGNTPDQISLIVVHADNAAQTRWCNPNDPNEDDILLNLRDLVSGNIKVFDNPPD